MIRRLLSYIVPINIHKQQSAISKTLEVTWANGQLVLDSRHTNYSFGSLQRVLRKGLIDVGFEKIRSMEHILVLGVAGGSVISTLNSEVGFSGKITGVEIDPEIISLASRYFGLANIKNLELVCEDAFEFVLRTKERYELVIIDIFQDTVMPNFLFEQYFIDRLAEIIPCGGYILFNTMTLSEADNVRNTQFKENINGKKFHIRALPRLEAHNELLVLHRI